MSTPDRRGPKRRRVLLGAKITYRGLATSIDCRVRDLSETGACLLVASPLGIPETFDLFVSDGSVKHCEVQWRKADKIGVSFA
jgi:PilZ domain-containing protein